nr:hypothetical transcript [Hymenolepis microstoma]
MQNWRRAVLSEDSCQTEELSESLSISGQATSKRLKQLGIIEKEEYWVPHELKPRDVEQRLIYPDVAPSDFAHLFRSMAHGLADQHSSYKEVKNWIDSWILSKDENLFSPRDTPDAREMGQNGSKR